ASQTALSDLDVARMEWLREIFNDGIPGDATRVMELCDIALRAFEAGDADLALNLLQGAAWRCWWANAGADAQARGVGATAQLKGVEKDPRYVATWATADPIRQGSAVVEMLSEFVVETIADADTLRLLGQAAHVVGEPVLTVDFL